MIYETRLNSRDYEKKWAAELKSSAAAQTLQKIKSQLLHTKELVGTARKMELNPQQSLHTKELAGTAHKMELFQQMQRPRTREQQWTIVFS
jgi:hypothetical protein